MKLTKRFGFAGFLLLTVLAVAAVIRLTGPANPFADLRNGKPLDVDRHSGKAVRCPRNCPWRFEQAKHPQVPLRAVENISPPWCPYHGFQ